MPCSYDSFHIGRRTVIHHNDLSQRICFLVVLKGSEALVKGWCIIVRNYNDRDRRLCAAMLAERRRGMTRSCPKLAPGPSTHKTPHCVHGHLIPAHRWWREAVDATKRTTLLLVSVA